MAKAGRNSQMAAQNMLKELPNKDNLTANI